MTACSLLVAACLSMGYGDVRDGGSFATPMFLRGQAVWVRPVSRRTLLKLYTERSKPKSAPVETEVAVVLA